MYHIVICDDEPIFLTQISEMIIDILASMGESCEIRKYTSISELKNTLQNTPKSCDILILDIMLGENNGISFAECLRDTENQIPVIFISSSKEFVFDAYSAEPVGYILKPVSRQKLDRSTNPCNPTSDPEIHYNRHSVQNCILSYQGYYLY
mgnify:FL=1